ncbi:hypothetical protein [Bathymodiolus japonicus methanotrophic gill symbiont]|uniref:hypothetical protein n=1 Tax=Bathymodiolus japonicus methanotrophic gill symbiont TaxID=113269 RepID=UPI001C8DFDDB|nr:hypothetical protein [Bathymodiolus japonicus methanotrophic gill symbiont]
MHAQLTDEELQQQLVVNIIFIQELANEIGTEAIQLYPDLKEYAPEIQASHSSHLQDIFTIFR